MSHKRWSAADALRADLTNHDHHLRAASEEEVERRMRKRYPGAVVILTRLEESWRQDPTASESSRHGRPSWPRTA